MAKNTVKAYPLRLPDPLRKKLEQATRESGKTLRAEILERLERSFASGQTDQAIADRLAALEARMDKLERTSAAPMPRKPRKR